MGTGALSPRVSDPRMRLTIHQSSAKVKNAWICNLIPYYVLMPWCIDKQE